MFPSAPECAQGIQCVLEGLLLFEGPPTMEEFSSTGQDGRFRFRNPPGNNAVVSLKNGGSVQSRPISMVRASGRCRVHGPTPRRRIQPVEFSAVSLRLSQRSSSCVTHQCDLQNGANEALNRSSRPGVATVGRVDRCRRAGIHVLGAEETAPHGGSLDRQRTSLPCECRSAGPRSRHTDVSTRIVRLRLRTTVTCSEFP